VAWHPILRTRLAGALTAAGPDAPTLCEGWRTRHLAAHLVLRQADAGYGLGLVTPALADRAERAVQALAGSADDISGFASLVARVVAGPPAWSPLRWAGDRADLLELVVHSLDVTRTGTGVVDPALEPELVEAIWQRLVHSAPGLLRSVPVGIVLVRPDGPRARVHRPRADTGTVVVRGPLADLALYCFGRRDAARVYLGGTEADLALLEAAPTSV
jgi:uncharacterized protein (TIGR03085 family)